MPPTGSRAPDLARLSEGARRVATVAAAIHEPFERSVLLAVVPGGGTPGPELHAAVDELTRSGVLVEAEGGRLALRPDLRESFGGRAFQTAAREVHRALAKLYAAEGRAREDAVLLALAYGYFRDAGAARDAHQVSLGLLPLLRRAGAWEEVVRVLTREAEATQGVDRLEVLAWLAEGLLRVQRFGESFRLYELLLRAVAGRQEERYQVVEAACRAAMGTFFFLDGSPTLARGSLEAAVQIRRGLRDPAGLSDALRRLAVLDLVEGDPVRAEQRAREALTLARRAQDAETHVLAAMLVADLAEEKDDRAAMRAVLEEATPVADGLDGALADDCRHARRRTECIEWLRVIDLDDVG